MQKFKSIKILFIFLAFNVFLAKYPLWNSLGALITIYLLNFEGINDDLKNFKISNYKYFFVSIPLILINYGLLFLISKVSPLPENEVLLRSLVRVSPSYYLLIFGVLSPICEELTFRYGFNGIKNKYIYMIFTSILYAVMHLSSFSEILYAIPYFILGLTFAYTYKKTGSLIYPVSIHIVNNLVSLLFIIF